MNSEIVMKLIYSLTSIISLTRHFLTSSSLHRSTMSISSKDNYKIPISCVVAATTNWGIGNKGLLPWESVGIKLPLDMAHFKAVTSHVQDETKMNAVIMGRKTWNSIPKEHRPLTNRLNIIITSSKLSEIEPTEECNNIITATSLNNAIDLIINTSTLYNKIESIMVIGGVQLFEVSILHPWFSKLYLTIVETEFECDTYLTSKTIEYIKNFDPSNIVMINPYIQENNVHYK